MFLWCEIPILNLQYIRREDTCPSKHNFTEEITNGSYMVQLQISHQAIYVRSINGNLIFVFYISLQTISRRYFGITYRGM
jgi:hypothetical protein